MQASLIRNSAETRLRAHVNSFRIDFCKMDIFQRANLSFYYPFFLLYLLNEKQQQTIVDSFQIKMHASSLPDDDELNFVSMTRLFWRRRCHVDFFCFILPNRRLNFQLNFSITFSSFLSIKRASPLFRKGNGSI